MNEIALAELEIVGFNGLPQVECGCALPIARRNSDGMHCVLKLRPNSGCLSWHSEEEAAQYATEKRWTLFHQPVFVPQKCLGTIGDEASGQPMVVFADDSVLDTADRPLRPTLAADEYLIWRTLQGYPDPLHAACGTSETVQTLLDEWAAALVERYDAMHTAGRDRPYLKRIADFSLCAARTRPLRWKAYLRYSLAQEPDKVRRSFDAFIQREFPDTPWEEFARHLHSLRDVLGVAVSHPPRQPNPALSESGAALPKVRNIAAEKPVKINGFPA